MSNHTLSCPVRKKKTTELYVVTEFGTKLPTFQACPLRFRVSCPWGQWQLGFSTVVLQAASPLPSVRPAPEMNPPSNNQGGSSKLQKDWLYKHKFVLVQICIVGVRHALLGFVNLSLVLPQPCAFDLFLPPLRAHSPTAGLLARKSAALNT